MASVVQAFVAKTSAASATVPFSATDLNSMKGLSFSPAFAQPARRCNHSIPRKAVTGGKKVTTCALVITEEASTPPPPANLPSAPEKNFKAPTTNVQRNVNFGKLQAGFLFPEIAARLAVHTAKYPDAKVISLGMGDTTQPIPPIIIAGMQQRVHALGTPEGYSGYGAEQGETALRRAVQRLYHGTGVKAMEVFISDGAQCDIARLQMMFGSEATIAVQDPSFPAYVDSGVIIGQTGGFEADSQQFSRIHYMKCTPENDFYPDLESTPRTDIIFFCSPNNPTGATASRKQLEDLVAFAKKNGSIIVFDAAYSMYVSDDSPRTIYEIPGSREVAIEISSFSKSAGFTGVRLGWTIVPEELTYAEGYPVIKDFDRVMTTCFNGASNIAQAGGLASLSPEGWKAMEGLVEYYKTNIRIIVEAVRSVGLTAYGGENAPYVWVHFPGRRSWGVFAEILERAHIVTMPGSGFGPGGVEFVRFSAFGQRQDIYEAADRLKKLFGGSQHDLPLEQGHPCPPRVSHTQEVNEKCQEPFKNTS